MNDELLLVETSLSAKFIAQILAENMEANSGRHFFKGFPHLVPLLLLEPSVKMCK